MTPCFANNCSLRKLMCPNWWWHWSVLAAVFVGCLSSSSLIINSLGHWILLMLAPLVSKGVSTGYHQRRLSTSDSTSSGSASLGWWFILLHSIFLSETICVGSAMMGSSYSSLWQTSSVAEKDLYFSHPGNIWNGATFFSRTIGMVRRSCFWFQ